MKYKKGGFRETIPAGIEYLERVLTQMDSVDGPKSDYVREKAEKKLEFLKNFQSKYALPLKKLGVIEDRGNVSMVFDITEDGNFFVFKDFCFVKTGEYAIQSVAKIVGKKKYIKVVDGKPTVEEVKW